MSSKRLIIFLFAVLSFSNINAHAQILSPENLDNDAETDIKYDQLFAQEKKTDSQSSSSTAKSKVKAGQAQTLEELDAKIVNGSIVMNKPNMPKTIDNSKRGDAGFIRVLNKGENSDSAEDNRYIFLYYQNFSMTQTYASGIGCRVRFVVLNNLDSSLKNLSVTFIWPGLSSSVSFDNVRPNFKTYTDYALFGKGCLNMHKIPNIVVNRCRAKGMTQEQCASRIRWLTRSSKR